MMIKPESINKLEAAIGEYLPVKNIMFNSSKINALFGPIFKELFERFTRILRQNVLCMLKKSKKTWRIILIHTWLLLATKKR